MLAHFSKTIEETVHDYDSMNLNIDIVAYFGNLLNWSCMKLNMCYCDKKSAAEQIADAKSEGKKAFAKGDYVAAIYSYNLVYP